MRKMGMLGGVLAAAMSQGREVVAYGGGSGGGKSYNNQYARRGKSKPAFDPRVNRWTGKPHEHKREIARNLKREQNHAQH